jgi:hypothetical protein
VSKVGFLKVGSMVERVGSNDEITNYHLPIVICK